MHAYLFSTKNLLFFNTGWSQPKTDEVEHPGDDISILELIESFSKPENLKHFPLIISLQVFSMVGDIDLLNLAEGSTRFESIAKIVLHDRYTRKYFTMDATKLKSLRYKEFLE